MVLLPENVHASLKINSSLHSVAVNGASRRGTGAPLVHENLLVFNVGEAGMAFESRAVRSSGVAESSRAFSGGYAGRFAANDVTNMATGRTAVYSGGSGSRHARYHSESSRRNGGHTGAAPVNRRPARSPGRNECAQDRYSMTPESDPKRPANMHPAAAHEFRSRSRRVIAACAAAVIRGQSRAWIASRAASHECIRVRLS